MNSLTIQRHENKLPIYWMFSQSNCIKYKSFIIIQLNHCMYCSMEKDMPLYLLCLLLVYSELRVAQFLVFCVMFFRPLFVSNIVLSILRRLNGFCLPSLLSSFFSFSSFCLYIKNILYCWIYNYLCNQCLSPLTLWVRSPFMAKCTRYNIMWFATGRWFSPGIPVSSTH